MTNNIPRILIIVSNLEYGGAQRQIVELVNNIDPTQYKVDIASLSDYVPLQSQLNTETQLHIVHKKSRFDFSVVFKLLKLIKKHKYQILHSYLFDAEIAARLAGYLSPLSPKVIGAERNTDYEFKKIQLQTYKLTNSMFDLIIANSYAGSVFNANALHIAADKYRVIYNGVNVEKFTQKDQSEMRKRIDIDIDCPVIGVFASFKDQKNHPFLLKALIPILEKYPNLKVLLVGDMLHGGMHGSDDYYTDILNMIEQGPLKKACVLMGNRDDVELLYPACDFTVLPSLFEGTPNVILESMSCGIPVIATRVSDNDRIIDHETGILIELNNHNELVSALEDMLDSPSKVKDMGIKARSRIIENFSTKMLAKNTCDVYDELLD